MSPTTWYQVSALSEVYDLLRLELVKTELKSRKLSEELDNFYNQPPRVNNSFKDKLVSELEYATADRRKMIKKDLQKIQKLCDMGKSVLTLNDRSKELKEMARKMKEDLQLKMTEVTNFSEPKTLYRVSDLSLIKKYREWMSVDIEVEGFGQRCKGDLQRFEDVSAFLEIKIPKIIIRNVKMYRKTPITDKVMEDGENSKLRYGLSSMQGWRSTMEDAHAAFPNVDKLTSFFGVYDGHGGKAVAKFCAKHLHQQMLKNEAYAAGDIGTSVQKAFLRMDEMMCVEKGRLELQILEEEELTSSPKYGEADGQVDDWPVDDAPQSDYRGPNAGSTACVAVVRNARVVVANAGDSRCVISRNRKAHDLSKEHKPVLEIEKKRIICAGGYIQCGRVNAKLHVSRAIGSMELKKDTSLPAEEQILTAIPDIKTIDLNDDDDFLVIASSDIWDCMTSQQVVSFVYQHISTGNLSVVCGELVDRILAGKGEIKGRNNLTVMIVEFKKSRQLATTRKC